MLGIPLELGGGGNKIHFCLGTVSKCAHMYTDQENIGHICMVYHTNHLLALLWGSRGLYMAIMLTSLFLTQT